jgi:hypothetical protein
VPNANEVMTNKAPSGLPAFDFLRLAFGELGQLVDLVHAVELATKEDEKAPRKSKPAKRETRASSKRASSDDDVTDEKPERQKKPPKKAKSQEDEEEEFIPSSFSKRRPMEDNIIESVRSIYTGSSGISSDFIFF